MPEITKKKTPYNRSTGRVKGHEQGYHIKAPVSSRRDIIEHRGGKKSYAKRIAKGHPRGGQIIDIQDKKRADSQDRLKANQRRYKYGADKQTPKQYYGKQKSKGLSDNQILDNLADELKVAEESKYAEKLPFEQQQSWIKRLLARVWFIRGKQRKSFKRNLDVELPKVGAKTPQEKYKATGSMLKETKRLRKYITTSGEKIPKGELRKIDRTIFDLEDYRRDLKQQL